MNSDIPLYKTHSEGNLNSYYQHENDFEIREGLEIENFIEKVIHVGVKRKNSFYNKKGTLDYPENSSATRKSLSPGKSLSRNNLSFHFDEQESEALNDLQKRKEEEELQKKSMLEHKKYSEFYSKLAKNNQEWIDKCKENNPMYFELMAQPQKPSCLVISCSDSRVVVNDCLGLKPGELFSHRNVGNLVISTDFNVQSVIQFAVQVLKVEHLIVVGHTDCGAVKSALTSKHHGLIDHWLRTIREIAEKHRDDLEELKASQNLQDKHINHTEIIRKMIELNVKEQVLSLCKTPIVQKAWKNGQTLFVHGYVLEIETGKLIDLDIKQEEWDEIEETYKFDFDDLFK